MSEKKMATYCRIGASVIKIENKADGFDTPCDAGGSEIAGVFFADTQADPDYTLTIVAPGEISLPEKLNLHRSGYRYGNCNNKSTTVIVAENTIYKIGENPNVLLEIKCEQLQLRQKAIATGVRFCASLDMIRKGGLPLHCCAVQNGVRSLVFAGPSGSGKTTVANLLRSDSIKVLNDEYNFLLPRNGEWHVIPTPYFRVSDIKPGMDMHNVLSNIFFLQKDEQTYTESLDSRKAFLYLVSNTVTFTALPEFTSQMMDAAARCVADVTCRTLHFSDKRECIALLSDIIKKEGE